MTDLDFFFHYETEIGDKTRFSNLCLLRRDVYTCFGINPNDRSSKLETMALWPGTMGILAGIDLLAKFYVGNDSVKRSVGKRFRKYVSEFIDENYQFELYQLRNALLHSFGLYSSDYDGKIFKFSLTRDLDYFVKGSSSNGKVCISIKVLHERFEKSIIEFKKVYPQLNSFCRFEELFKKYGMSGINDECLH